MFESDPHRWPTYPPRGVTLTEAIEPEPHGSCRLRDKEGREFLDAVGGIGCAPLGHAHPRWRAAIDAQLGRLAAAANTFHTEPQQRLAAELAARVPVPEGKVFFCNTGAEATEAAIKIALRATGRDTIIAFEGAFHGRTLGAIALTANPAYRQPYVACDGEDEQGFFARAHVRRVPFGDLDALRAVFDDVGSRVAAVFLEPIQGESGVFPATREFLLGVRELCTQHGALLGLDEIQTGVGRTGAFTAWSAIVGDAPEHAPDLLWLAKALGGGFPIGACIARAPLAEHMQRGTHGTTFGGNPVACAAGVATLEVLDDEELMASAGRQIDLVRALAQREPIAQVAEIRGYGAMIGIQIGERSAKAAATLAPKLQALGLFVTVCGGHTVRWLFPYRASEPELNKAWGILRQALAHE